MFARLDYYVAMRKKRNKNRRPNKSILVIGSATLVLVLAITAHVFRQYRETQTPAPPTLALLIKKGAIVYTQSSIDRKIIGRVEGDRVFNLVGRGPEGRWLQIDYHGETGWIHGPLPQASSPIFKLPVRGGKMTGELDVSGTMMSLYAEPHIGKRPNPITIITHGDKFTVLGRHEKPGWIFIQSGDKKGWVFRGGMENRGSADISHLPIITVEQADILMEKGTPVPPP